MSDRIQDIPISELLSEIRRLEAIAEHNTIAATILDLYKQEASDRLRRSTRQISAPFIRGVCACCGAPDFVDDGQKHDGSCIYYES
jgi:hypothetical protein